MTPLLGNPAYAPRPVDISYSGAAFQEFLAMRSGSDLFHMSSSDQVQQNLLFLNTGPNQIPGLIVMKLDAHGHHYQGYQHILVVFNATNSPVTFSSGLLVGEPLQLHPVQQHSKDPIVRQSRFDVRAGAATVPALTTAVFVAALGH
jgi:pullulanase